MKGEANTSAISRLFSGIAPTQTETANTQSATPKLATLLTKLFGNAPEGKTTVSEGWVANVLRQIPVEDSAVATAATKTTAMATVNPAAWPPRTHDKLLSDAFPGLTPTELRILQNGSRTVDVKFEVVAITLLESNAPKHAMTPASKVREYIKQGMEPKRAVEEAQKWAAAEAKKWVDNQGETAKRLQAEYRKTNVYPVSNDALYEFGKGAHTLMDNTSPAHRPFQIFLGVSGYILSSRAEDVASGIARFTIDLREHSKHESQPPTETESKATTEALRNYFRNVFGEEAYQQAVTKK